MAYARYQPVIAAARARPALWRLLLGLATVVAVAVLWMAGLVALVEALAAPQLGGLGAGGATPAASALFLALIAGLGVGTWIAARIWQKRSLGSLLGRGARCLRHFALAVATTWMVIAAISLLGLPFGPPLAPNLDPATWALWLLPALALVALQTGSEELLFRGYLQSQLAARFRSPLAWLVGPALVFGAVHFVPGMPASAGLVYVGAAAFFGLLAGDLTARTGTLGAAWGFHFANNAVAILIVAEQNTLTGLALWRGPDLARVLTLSPLLIADLVAMAVVYLVIRRLAAG